MVRFDQLPALVHSDVTQRRWSVQARPWRYQVDLDEDGTAIEPPTLPVPPRAERRNVDTDFADLAGRLRCVVRERGKVVFTGTSELAGLDVGSLPDRD